MSSGMVYIAIKFSNSKTLLMVLLWVSVSHSSTTTFLQWLFERTMSQKRLEFNYFLR